MFEENWDEPETTHVVSQSCSNVEVPNANINYKERKTHFSSASQRFKNDSCWRANNNANNFSKRDTFNDRRRNSNDLVLRVEGRKIGMIIGRQGSKIKELTEKSGARIKIGGPSKDDDYLTEVFITGSVESQNSCKLLIDDLLGENKESPLFSSAPAVDSSVPLIDWDTINEKAVVAEAKRWEKCPPLKKDFYFEDPEVAKLSEEEVEQFRKNNNNIVVRNISDSNEKILNPVQTFAQAFKLYPEIMREIEKQGFQTPSPIQAQAWPILLSGKDLIGIAQTGTGKTLAFLLPALIHIDGQTIPRSERGGANVLVIAPTRELALQIESEVKKYSYKGIKCVCVYGGGNRREQMKVVASGVEIIIATPGRLNDLVEANVIDVSSITYVVLDEADRMLDMGFEPQIKKVLLDIRPDRQSVMTSATWPSNVQRLAERYMNNPIQVYIGSLDLAAVHSVTQTVLVIDEDDKRDCLLHVLTNLEVDDKIIVFVGKKKMADDLSCDLSLNGILCQCIHGDREQLDREQALEDLRTGAVNILIATDVASRGLDICDITKVLNYDFPRNIEEYVHRVGRTGRAGRTGEAITYFTRADWAGAGDLIKILEEANQGVPEELYSMRDRFQHMLKKKEEERSAGIRPPGNGRRSGRHDYNRY